MADTAPHSPKSPKLTRSDPHLPANSPLERERRALEVRLGRRGFAQDCGAPAFHTRAAWTSRHAVEDTQVERALAAPWVAAEAAERPAALELLLGRGDRRTAAARPAAALRRSPWAPTWCRAPASRCAAAAVSRASGGSGGAGAFAAHGHRDPRSPYPAPTLP
eukprot:353090-Chlamydomonas_euryale.AAC.2